MGLDLPRWGRDETRNKKGASGSTSAKGSSWWLDLSMLNKLPQGSAPRAASDALNDPFKKLTVIRIILIIRLSHSQNQLNL